MEGIPGVFRSFRKSAARSVATGLCAAFAAVIVAVVAPWGNAGAQQAPVEIKSRCYDCHLNPDPQEGTRQGPRVDGDLFRKTVHGGQRCESCHTSITEIPHDKDLPPVDCRGCHRADNTAGAPQLKSYREYDESVHGRLVAADDPRAPRCQNCHGDHDILKPAESASHVNKFQIANTCGHCHEKIADTYRASSHGYASIVEGNVHAPVCTDCHGEHSIMRHGEEASTVSRGHVVSTCASCHGEITEMGVFGEQGGMVDSYRESYHGVAYKFGSAATATCVECHGHHDIRGRNDPKSRIYPENVPATCGQAGCHEGAGPGFAAGRVHVSFHGPEERYESEGRDRSFAKVFKVTELAFIGLTTSVIFLMILYMALDLFDKWVREEKKRARYFLVVTIPLVITFWLVWKATLVFIEKFHA